MTTQPHNTNLEITGHFARGIAPVPLLERFIRAQGPLERMLRRTLQDVARRP